jgi:Cytochrome c
MKHFICLTGLGFLLLASCKEPASPTIVSGASSEAKFGGFESEQQWGQHLVSVSSCNNCHSPKIMTAQGPEIDSSRILSGHAAESAPPDVNRKELESKGLVVTGDETAWVGPWGTSFTANLTSDSTTGIGSWTEGQFIECIRHGRYNGAPNGRRLLPPMPWESYRNMSDDELKAVLTYLKSTRPVHNAVPPPQPPVSPRRPT